MGRNRFTVQGVTRLPLSDGDWIEVKTDLNNGELQALRACGLEPPVKMADGTITRPIDWARYDIEQAAIWLLDWSFVGEDDKPVPLKTTNGTINVDALNALDPPDFDEIDKAIQAHVVQRSKEKNAQREARMKNATLPNSEPTSQS